MYFLAFALVLLCNIRQNSLLEKSIVCFTCVHFLSITTFFALTAEFLSPNGGWSPVQSKLISHRTWRVILDITASSNA